MNSIASPKASLEQKLYVLDKVFDSLSINASEKEKIITLLKKQEHSDTGLAEILRQENLIKDEDMQYIRIFDTHLQTLHQDEQFGRLAVANGMASEEEVAIALKYQETYFEKYHINIKIEEVLVENKAITNSDRLSILLTQNRIEDENLLDALDGIGTTLMQKDEINKRFGAIAVKMGLITTEQLDTALEIQNQERNTQEKPRFIGRILQETAQLSDADTLQILLEQKHYEKRRLDLEKALYTIKSEIKISKKLNQFFDYRISKDGTEAFVKKIMKIEEEISTYEFLILLKRAGIKVGIVSDAILEEFIQKAEKNAQIIVAKGYPAEPCTNEEIRFYFKNEDDKPVSFKKGNLLAQIIPGKEGKPGRSVLGFPILPAKPSVCRLNAGNGVIKKGLFFFAHADGSPVLKGDTLNMVQAAVKTDDIKTLQCDIADDTKDIYESAIVKLLGTIAPEGILRCRSLLLDGNVLGCVICTGNIEIKGNIGISDKDTIPQKGKAPQTENQISETVTKTKIHTAGELSALNSVVAGSEIIAANGMTVKDVLKQGQTPSILQFGLKPGDKILAIDQTIEVKTAQLSDLKQEDKINELTEEFKESLKKEETRQIEQTVLNNLVEIIEAPELYQYEGLNDKINYLERLPGFSSIKSYYLKIPETKAGLEFRKQIIASIGKMSLDNFLTNIKKKIEPEPEDKEGVSPIDQIKVQFKARLAVFEQEIADKSEEIGKIEYEIKGLQTIRAKLEQIYLDLIPQSKAEIKIRNSCEKGTIIKGRIARLVVEKELYNIKFKEVVSPITKIVSILIDTY